MSTSLENPLVSILIPLYNALPYLKEMIESIISQTYSNWELIVVDDGSTDTGPEVVMDYVAKDKRIKFLKRPETRKKGGNTCRNFAFENSKGEYVIWFDADDLIAPYCLEQRIKFMENNPNLDFGVFPAIGFTGKLGNWTPHYYGFNSEERALNNLIGKNLPFIVWTNIYRRNSLINNKIEWDENLISLQDSDFNITCLNNNLFFKESVSPADYFWRQTPNSISTKIKGEKHIDNIIYFFNKTAQLFKDRKDLKDDIILSAIWSYKIIEPLSKEKSDDFFKSNYFKDKTFLRNKIKLAQKLNKSFSNSKIQLLINLFFFPKVTIKNKYYLSIKRNRNSDYKSLIEFTDKALQLN